MIEASTAGNILVPHPPRLEALGQRNILGSARIEGFQERMEQVGLRPLTAEAATIFQVNVGKLCNQACRHCHVDAGPDRILENMDWRTFEACLSVIAQVMPRIVDITGGAPELNPNFRRFVRAARDIGVPELIDRCNLSVLLLEGQKGLAEFLAEQRVHIAASLPAVNAQQTDAQRGDGVFGKSIKALRMLNNLGYGHSGSGLLLTLVSNPPGAFLPPPQSGAEARFRTLLKRNHGVEFNDLIELTNMPINRFLEYLLHSGNFQAYMEKLSAAFNPRAVQGLMCRNTLSVGWDGQLYDCDFNQMLELPVHPLSGRPGESQASLSIFDYQRELMEGRAIVTANHCLGCMAGQGSSCGGATV